MTKLHRVLKGSLSQQNRFLEFPMQGRAFSYQAALPWNQIPDWVQEADILSAFKIRFKLHYLKKVSVRAGSAEAGFTP